DISDDKESSENRGPSSFQPLTNNSQSEDDSTISDKLGFRVTMECNMLIYYKLNPSSLNLHVYLIPRDPVLQKTVHEKEDRYGYKEIEKPRPDNYLKMKRRFILTADMETAKVIPQGLKLRYHINDPHFYEVYIDNPEGDFNLTLCRTKTREPVWTCGIEEDDYRNSLEVDVSDDDEASENRGPSSSQPRPLPEVSAISSENEGTSRSSESGSITDSSDWTTLEPEVNSPDADEAPTYSLQSEAGRFECRVSNLRWVCKEKVSFKYQFGTLPEYLERTERLGYMPAGPILDIKVISGKLNEVYLPHWICTDDSTISDKFAVLHVDDACGEVVEEVSEVTPHHVKLLEPTFSPRMVLVRLGLPVKIKCNVLIYYKLKRSYIKLHVYLIPHDPGLQKTVHQRENKDGYKEIEKPRPDNYLKMKQRFILTADMETAKVIPQELKLRYHSNDPNFCEVYIENPGSDFNLTLCHTKTREQVWTCEIRKDDYRNSLEGGTEMQRRIHVEKQTPAHYYPPQTRSSGRKEIQMNQIPKRATTQRDAGSTTSNVQHGSVITKPGLTNVRIGGNLTLKVSNRREYQHIWPTSCLR
ncbi:NACHT%2C LRR and PYD domains-containing protein 1 homolog, partial [Scomber scombrus]